jgi:type IV secretory pathway VirB10-like protein
MNLNSLITAPARIGLALGGRIAGLIQGRLGGQQPDDDTIKQQVEADVFSSRRVARAKVQIEVTEGVVWVRGEVKSASIVEEVESRAAAITGVRRVENLLRVAKPAQKPKTQKRPAPKRSSRPKPAAATAPPPDVKPVAPLTPPPAAQKERPVTRRFNAEERSAEAESSPSELAARGEGRQPAPLGATDPAEGKGGSPAAPFPSGVANGNGADES